MTQLSARSAPMRLVSVVTAINVLVAAGFSIAGLVRPNLILPMGYVPTEASFIFAMLRRGPHHSARLHGLDCDLQAVAISNADIGYIGGLHPIAGCGRGLVAA